MRKRKKESGPERPPSLPWYRVAYRYATKPLSGDRTLGSISGFIERTRPFVRLSLRFVPSDAVTFLHPAHQLILLARNRLPIVIGQLAPTLAGAAGELLPLAFYLVPI